MQFLLSFMISMPKPVLDGWTTCWAARLKTDTSPALDIVERTEHGACESSCDGGNDIRSENIDWSNITRM